MKKFQINIILALILIIQLTACQKLTDLNVNPNSPVSVSSNYILTYVLLQTSSTYAALGDVGSDVSGAMQYGQSGTNQSAPTLNQLLWTPSSWAAEYDALRNIELIHANAIASGNKLFEAISLVLRAFNFGLATDLFGDIPYSEALLAGKTGLYFPVYDKQSSVYKGVLADLKAADALLGDPTISTYGISASADLLYKGSAAGWRKFANSLRMRYAMRLINKKTDMTALGVDVIAEFNAAVPNAFTSTTDEAFIPYLGTAANTSYPGGLLRTANPNFTVKPCKTIVDSLKLKKDPRLYRWVLPVTSKWDATVSGAKTYTNPYNEAQAVTYAITTNFALDTTLFVGLAPNLAVIDLGNFNRGTAALPSPDNPEKRPWVSFLHGRYRLNSDPLIRMDLMSYSEVEFLQAEAAQRGGFATADPETHFKNGILASMKRWGITDGASGFNFASFYSNPTVSYALASNKLERIINQKWVSLWLNVESWFDWRRTGYPNLKTGPVTQYGAALPLRFMYPLPNLDPAYLVNYKAAVANLVPTNYVPVGQSADHSYSKMWLLQNTGFPY